jgi:type III restriction enzyme
MTVMESSRTSNWTAQTQRLKPTDDNGSGPKKKLTKKDRAELLRKTVDTIGREGQPGEQIQNVISVGMLSEGWDAKTVTHIMGLRAFTSQLLCEQVVGRGLRRTSYELHPETRLGVREHIWRAFHVSSTRGER